MDFTAITDFFTPENMETLLSRYADWGGPAVGILLPFLEALFPFLPLVVIVMTNAAAFGLWKGFLYSWTGAITGAWLVFFIARTYGQPRLEKYLHKNPRVDRAVKWVERHGFGPLFLLLSFPFTPSFFINIMSGLSKINPSQFLLAVMLGKVMMIFGMSYVGADLHSFITSPAKAIILGAIITFVWFVGKKVEKHYKFDQEMKSERE